MAIKARASNTKRTRRQAENEAVIMQASVTYEMPKKKFTLHDLKDISPMTNTQERVFDLWQDDYSLVLEGSAGSGKTFLALFLALREVLSGKSDYKKVILVRSCTPTKEIGFLPGTLEEKEEIYELPFKQICDDIFKRPNQYKHLKESGIIEFVNTSFVRGMTFKNAIVILDESQSCNYHEISTVVTRLGNFSKIVVCGDVIQSDLIYRKNEQSGLPQFLAISKMIPSFRNVHFTTEDIVRSGLVREFLIAEERFKELQK